MQVDTVAHNVANVQAFVEELTHASFPVTCSECSSICKTATGFLNHLTAAEVPRVALMHLKSLRNADRRNARIVQGPVEEIPYPKESSYLSPDPHDYRKVVCTADSCKRSIPKKDLMSHFTKHKAHKDHPLPLEQVLKWKSHTDGLGIRHIGRHHKTIEELSTSEAACKLELAGPIAGQQYGVAPSADAPAVTPLQALPPPEPPHSPQAQELLAHTAALLALTKAQLAVPRDPQAPHQQGRNPSSLLCGSVAATPSKFSVSLKQVAREWKKHTPE